MSQNLSSAKGIRILPAAGMILLVIVLNEFSFAWIGKGRFVDLPGRHQNLLFYMPWLLRTLDIFLLGTAAWLGIQKITLGKLFQSSVNYNLFTLAIGIGLLWFSNPIVAGRFMAFRILAVCMLLLYMAFVFHLVYIRKVSNRVWIGEKAGLVVFGLGLAFLGMEICFMLVAKSHHTSYSYAAKVWHYRYWKLNDQNYRDRNFSQSEMKGKYKIAFLGDSFTAGAGIKDPKLRFSDLTATALGDQYYGMNLGVNGLDTGLELEQLENFEFQPDLLVYSWYINDIHQAAFKAGLDLGKFEMKGANYRPSLSPFNGFYALNYLYWMYPHHEKGTSYFDFLKAAFAHPLALANHFQDLANMKAYCASHQIEFVVVLFPWLSHVSASQFAIQPVAEWLEKENVPYLSLADKLAKFSAGELIVNNNDAHPNEFVHQMVADTLTQFLKKKVWDQN